MRQLVDLFVARFIADGMALRDGNPLESEKPTAFLPEVSRSRLMLRCLSWRTWAIAVRNTLALNAPQNPRSELMTSRSSRLGESAGPSTSGCWRSPAAATTSPTSCCTFCE